MKWSVEKKRISLAVVWLGVALILAVTDNKWPKTCPADFQDIGTAPRDGTIIEICNQGAMPYYHLSQWSDLGEEGEIVWRADDYKFERFVWQDPGRQAYYQSDAWKQLKWRRTDQKPGSYVDPTNGAQNTAEYQR